MNSRESMRRKLPAALVVLLVLVAVAAYLAIPVPVIDAGFRL